MAVSRMRQNTALFAAVIGVLELLGALGCLITTLLFGNLTNSELTKGQLYSKYYDSSSPTRRYGTNGGTYWWAGIPFLLPGMIGIIAFATKNSWAMIAFLIANLISFFGGIGLAIFVGLFYNLWKIPMKAYAEKNCIFEYHQQTSQTFCQCKITDKIDVQTMDADRLWIYVQGCDEVEIINVMLLVIISLSIVTSIIAFACTYISCYALKYPEKPKRQQKTGFNPLPPGFKLEPETKPMISEPPRQEMPLQARDAYDEKPKSYKSQYASNYPPPYQAATQLQEPEIKKSPPPDDDDEEGIDGGWL
eukprot:Seg1758.4 transcript_id=Seg1758.4/GoldUCD/mRNA.D3Y31 product="hypothetical protein" protein_id=Seg1758.4/GoldUCD/D3Y31